MDTRGNQPLTQQTRDTMAQTDHDKLVEYGVMLQNIMLGQTRLEQQIKDLIQGQATSLATWEATSKAVHDSLDLRVRKLEDLSMQYLPIVNAFELRIKTIETNVQSLSDNKNQVVAGWKVTIWLIGSMAGFASTIWIILQLLFHLHLM